MVPPAGKKEDQPAAAPPPKPVPSAGKKGDSRVRLRANELKASGLSGAALSDELSSYLVELKVEETASRCQRCWHDLKSRCICRLLPMQEPTLPVKVIILMHSVEFMSAGDDAKLLPAMLPAENSSLFVFGRAGDWERFEAELAVDPAHTLTLWPGEDALTIQEFVANLPPSSPWRTRADETPPSQPLPTLRVVVLDGVYNHARKMFKAMKNKLPAHLNPPFVALHPTTLSVYHRATKKYGASSAQTVTSESSDLDPAALRICTVEAYALLLREMGEEDGITRVSGARVRGKGGGWATPRLALKKKLSQCP